MNNRLYIEDTATGERLLLAKSFGAGWVMWPTPGQLNDWLWGRGTALQLRAEHKEETPPCGVT